MATDFVGCMVLVTVRSPSNAKIRGIVIDISNQMLFLRDVCWVATGLQVPTFQIASSNLADLEVLPEDPQDAQAKLHETRSQGRLASADSAHQDANESMPSSMQGSFSQLDPIPAEEPTKLGAVSLAYHDPAILSTIRPSSLLKSSVDLTTGNTQASPQRFLAEPRRSSPTKATPAIPDIRLHSKPNSSTTRESFARTSSFATLSEPFNDLSVGKSQEEPESEAAELGTDGGKDKASLLAMGKTTRNSRRIRKTAEDKRNQAHAAIAPQVEEADSSPVNLRRSVQINPRKQARPNGSGLTSSKFLPDLDEGNRNTPKKRSSRVKSREGIKLAEATNGWATEDATDIQELGDFDFQANHAKFDKKEIFRQMKRDDKTAVESRLVNHNRRPKAGTRGGLDLHWSENVLEVPHVVSNGVAKWNSEAGESDEEANEAKVGSGRDSRRTGSRQNTFRTPSRKSSAKGFEDSPSANPGIDSVATPASRPISTTITRSANNEVHSPRSKVSSGVSPYLASVPSSRPSLRLNGTNKPCPILSPLQMLEYEQFGITELGLTEEIFAENAARGIAQTAVAVLRDANKNASVLKSHILVLAGNHRSGARAIAAARHLHCHNFRVTVALMGSDRDEDLLDAVRQQVHVFRKVGGLVAKSLTLIASLRANSTGTLPNLIIDALLGIHLIFDDLRGDDQAWYYELVLLINRKEWRVLSVDVPSGLDAMTGKERSRIIASFTDRTGEISRTDATPSQALAFFPAAVVSLAAPKPWILATLLQTPRAMESEPSLFVADIGLSNVVWKRLGNRRSKGLEFAGEWLRTLRYDPGDS